MCCLSYRFDQNRFVLFDCCRLTLNNVDDRVAGKYRCIAKNQLGTIQNDFQLLIRGTKNKIYMYTVVYVILVYRRFDILATIS